MYSTVLNIYYLYFTGTLKSLGKHEDASMLYEQYAKVSNLKSQYVFVFIKMKSSPSDDLIDDFLL